MEDNYGCALMHCKADGQLPDEFTDNYHVLPADEAGRDVVLRREKRVHVAEERLGDMADV
jgi:hypothetical protein